jgi:phage protein D
VIGIGYALLIDNQPAPAEVVDAIEHIDVERDLGMADVLRLELGVALSDDGEQWTIADEGVFSRLTQVRLVLTLGLGLPKPIFDGYVAETNLELSEDPGASKLTVVALDATALMNLEERVREWPNLPDSAIATMIFADHALIPVVTTTSPVRSMVDTTIIQRDTDIRFLRHLAHRNGFDMYAQPSPVPGVAEGHFHPPTLDMPPQGVLSVNLGEMTNVRSFSVKHQLLRPAAAEVASVDAKTVETQTATVDTTSLTELGRTSLLGGTPPRLSAMRTHGLSTGGELQTFAQAAVDRSAWAVTVEGELESALYGDALDVGQTVLVRGAGAAHSGTYFVDRVHHVIEGEKYTQRFTLRRNAVTPLGTEVFVTDTALPG